MKTKMTEGRKGRGDKRILWEGRQVRERGEKEMDNYSCKRRKGIKEEKY